MDLIRPLDLLLFELLEISCHNVNTRTTIHAIHYS